MAKEAKDEAGVQEKKATRTRTSKAASPKKSVSAKENASESVAESLAELKSQPKKKPAQQKNSRAADPTSIIFSAGSEETNEPVAVPEVAAPAAMTSLLFQEPDVSRAVRARRQRKSAEKPAAEEDSVAEKNTDVADDDKTANADGNANGDGTKKRRRGSRGGRRGSDVENSNDSASTEEAEAPATKTKKAKASKAKDNSSEAAADEEPAVRRRRRRRSSDTANDEVAAPKGSTRLEAKRQRRKEGRESGRRRQTITESEYLARRESVDRDMLIRERDGLNQIAVIEDGVLVEHYVARHTQSSMVGNVYLGRVQNVLPSMEAAFVDIGKGRNAVLYAGEVNWDASGLTGKPRKIEQALKSGDPVVVQVTKDPIGHKGARLTAQITLAGRHLVLVPGGAMTGISRKLPERERNRLKKILKEIIPAEHGVIVRTAAEGATEDQLKQDVTRLMKSWGDIQAKSGSQKNAPTLLKGEPELAVRVVRDIFNEDFRTLRISGKNAWETISHYVEELSPELIDRLEKWESPKDIFAQHRVDEQLHKAFDRKVFLPSGGSLVIDRTEAMTVIDVNTGKFTGSGGSLEETVTRNNLEAAEEIVRQLRLRDIGGIIVVDFIDMVLEANRDLVLRRLIECLGRDRTRHQVAEVTSLGLVQMTRKRVGQGLVEAFSTTCECCEGRGYISHDEPVEHDVEPAAPVRQHKKEQQKKEKPVEEPDPKHAEVKAALASIAAAASSKHETSSEATETAEQSTEKNSEQTSQKKAKRGRPRKNATHEAEKSKIEKKATPVKADVADTESKKTEGEQPQRQNPVAEVAEKPDSATKKAKKRVTSAGTITPSSPVSSAIFSFPVKAKDAEK